MKINKTVLLFVILAAFILLFFYTAKPKYEKILNTSPSATSISMSTFTPTFRPGSGSTSTPTPISTENANHTQKYNAMNSCSKLKGEPVPVDQFGKPFLDENGNKIIKCFDACGHKKIRKGDMCVHENCSWWNPFCERKERTPLITSWLA